MPTAASNTSQGEVTKEDVSRLAALARIALTDIEIERLRADIERIVEYVSEISEAEVGASQNTEKAAVGAVYNVLREDGDAHERGAYTDTLLAQVPRRENRSVRVKRIL